MARTTLIQKSFWSKHVFETDSTDGAVSYTFLHKTLFATVGNLTTPENQNYFRNFGESLFSIWYGFTAICFSMFPGLGIICLLRLVSKQHDAERPLGFYQISTTKKKPNIDQIIWNIDHTALYRPQSSLISPYLHYLLSSPDINIFWENEAYCEIWGINEDHFNWVHLRKHCIWTTLLYAHPLFRPL